MRSNLQPGVVLADRFVLEVPVGAGGMAIVYRARDLQTGAQVAVKVLRSDISAEYSASHFLREAEILASLAHPHVVSYVAHGQAVQGPAYLAMEWLEGQDLSRSLSLAPLRLSDSLQLITCVAAALSFHPCTRDHSQGY
jgi:serine/threonine protein kinase